ncbi:response regulator [Bacillaceae bacterium S4-13-56]
MIKLLIVDDEQIEREGMEVILSRGFPDLVIEQAKNGRMSIVIAKEFQPDLILMDIKMPGIINGLQAIEEITKINSDIKFIMVTAYDTFDYARQALKLGVKDYLLKPSKASEIVATVGKVLKEIEEEKEQQVKTKVQQEALQKALTVVETDVVTQLLFDHVHEVHLNELVGLLDMRTTKEKFVISVLLPKGSEHLYSLVKDKIRQSGSGWVGALYSNQLPIIVFRKPDVSYRSQAIALARDILSVAPSDSVHGWFVGIGNVYQSLDKIRQSYQESLIATMDTNIPAKYRFYNDVPILGSPSEYQSKHREKEFFDHIRSGQWDEVSSNIMNLIQRYESEKVDLVQAQQRILELLWIASRILNEIGVDIEPPLYSFQASDYRQLRSETNELLDQMKEVFWERYSRFEPDVIHEIKQYIMEHSHEDISLEAIGNKVGLSPIYISKIFKEQLGVNYINFLTECRIEKAKKLMSDPEKSMKEITYEVGYHNPNYFSKVFKKMCNISPTDYRKQLLGNKGNIPDRSS